MIHLAGGRVWLKGKITEWPNLCYANLSRNLTSEEIDWLQKTFEEGTWILGYSRIYFKESEQLTLFLLHYS